MIKWQRPYHDIPVDDYLTSEQFLLSHGFELDYVPNLHELIGPHEGRYMNLMRHDRKPICLLDKPHLKYWEEEISLRNYQVIPASEDEVVVYLPEEKNRALKLVSLLDVPHEHRDFDHSAKFGYLLGYTSTCIEAFYTRLMYLQVGNESMAFSDIFKSVEKFEKAKRDETIIDLSEFIEEIIHDFSS